MSLTNPFRFINQLIQNNIGKTYRPSDSCKLCDSKFETEFKIGAHRRQLKAIPCKFFPCLHNLVCLDCAEKEKRRGERYEECPFCGEKIKRVTYKDPKYDGYMAPDYETYWYSNNEMHIDEYWVPGDTVQSWSNKVLYQNN